MDKLKVVQKAIFLSRYFRLLDLWLSINSEGDLIPELSYEGHVYFLLQDIKKAISIMSKVNVFINSYWYN